MNAVRSPVLWFLHEARHVKATNYTILQNIYCNTALFYYIISRKLNQVKLELGDTEPLSDRELRFS